MGELFRQKFPEMPLAWTGERMVPGQVGPIEAEHFHRYLLARELCRGRDVLDVAAGEGYGSAFLAQTARTVVGVEVDPESVEHATTEYCTPNLRFVQGDAVQLPLDDRSVDVVVSFETLEHVPDQRAFLAEIKRILRPGGFLIISTPDVNVYSGPGTESNPYHVRELSEAEFREALTTCFRNLGMLRQRAITGSVMIADGLNHAADAAWIFEQRNSLTFEADKKLLRAPFLVAVASDDDLPLVNASLYIQAQIPSAIPPAVQTELNRLRELEDTVRAQEPAVSKAISDAATIPALQSEVDRLRAVEAAAREQNLVLARTQAEAARLQAGLHASLANELTAERKQNATLLEALRAELTAERVRNASLLEGLEDSRNELSSARTQLEAAQSLARQHSLATQRSLTETVATRRDVQWLEGELLEAQRERDQFKTAYEQAANLLVPLRLRSAVPEFLKAPARAIKRTLQPATRRSP